MNKNIFFLTFLLISCSENKTVPAQNHLNSTENKVLTDTSKNSLEAIDTSSALTWGENIDISYEMKIPGKSNNEVVELLSRDKKYNRYLRYKSLNFVYKKVTNQAISENDVYDIGDENAIIFPELSTSEYVKVFKNVEAYSNDSTLNSTFKLSFQLNSKIENVSNIELNSYFLNTETNSLFDISNKTVMRYENQEEVLSLDDVKRQYFLKEDGLKTQSLYTHLKNGNRIIYKIKNYNLGSETYKSIHEKIYKKFARVIISTEKEDKVIYAKKGASLLETLNSKFEDVEVSQNGNIKFINDLMSEVDEDDYFLISKTSDRNDLKGWFHFEKDINRPLEASTEHFVVYTSKKEVLLSKSKKLAARRLKGDQEIEINNLLGYENIYLNISSVSREGKVDSKTISSPACFYTKARNIGRGKGLSQRPCKIIENIDKGYVVNRNSSQESLDQIYFNINGDKVYLNELQSIGALKIIQSSSNESLYEINISYLSEFSNTIKIGTEIKKWNKSYTIGSAKKIYSPPIDWKRDLDSNSIMNHTWRNHTKVFHNQKEIEGFIWVQ
jgi:hypothetical protein